MKEQLLNIINKDEWSSLPEFFNSHVSKSKNKAELEEVLYAFSRPQQAKLCKGIYSSLIDAFSIALDDNANQEVGEVQLENVSTEDKIKAENLAKCVLDLAFLYMKTIEPTDDDQPEIFEGLLEATVLTSGVLPGLTGNLWSAALAFTEVWVLNKFEESDHICVNVFLARLKECLADGAKKSEIKKLWALRNGLQLIPITGEEEDKEIQLLLLQAMKSSVFLSCDEGIGFLSLLFTFPCLVMQLHKSMKDVLPHCTLSQSSKYGEVYFRVWKKSEGEQKQFFEENCVQDLMYRTVHIDPYGSRLFNNLNQLLGYIHKQKRHYQVADMICQLYQPFLWRSLKVANGIVRMNAVTLLCDAFPFTDSSLNQEETQSFIERQYTSLLATLTDPCHLVRIAALKGITSILCNYWLMVPAHVIKSIFKLLLTDLAVDASSSEVRCLVVKSFIRLLDCKCALPFVKEVISRIAGSFDDVNANVRICFIKLLLKIKATKCVKYWEIVPVEHLLVRLEMDGPSVGRLITKLLMHSFFPPNLDEEELLHRCFSILEENRGAARKFYYYASRSLDINTTVHFMLLIWRTLKQYIAMQQQDSTVFSVDGNVSQEDIDIAGPSQNKSSRGSKSAQKRESATKENKAPSNNDTNIDKDDTGSGEEDSDDEEMPLDNPEVVAGLLDTVAILWASNIGKLKKAENYKYIHALNTKVSRCLPQFCSFFRENSEVSQTLLYISSFLPRAMVPTLVGHCISRLRSLEGFKFESDKQNYITYVNALCNWNRTDDIIELVSDSLEQGFKTSSVSTAKERRKRSRGVRFQDIEAMNPLLALKVLHHMLEHPLNRLAVIPDKIEQIKNLVNLMSTIMDLSETRLGGPLAEGCSDEFLFGCWEEYLSVLVVLHNNNATAALPIEPTEDNENIENPPSQEKEFNCLSHYSQCIDWASKTLLSILNNENIDENGKRTMRDQEDVEEFCWSTISMLLFMSSSVVLIGAADSTFCTSLCKFTLDVLKFEPPTDVIRRSLGVASEISQFSTVYESLERQQEIDEYSTDIIKTCLSIIAKYLSRQNEPSLDLTTLSNQIVSSLILLHQDSEIKFQEIIHFIVKLILDDLSLSIDKVKGVDDEITRVNDLDKVPAFFVTILKNKAKFSSELMSAFSNTVKNEVQDIKQLLACVYLLSVLKEDCGRISRYNLKQAVMATDSVISVLTPQENEEIEDGDDIHGFARLYVRSSKKILLELKTSLELL